MTTDVLSQAETDFSMKVIIEVDAALARKRVDGRRVSQAWLAKRVGKSPVWLSDRMTGRVRLTVDDLALIAWGLSVSVRDLVPPNGRYVPLADLDLANPPIINDLAALGPTIKAWQRATAVAVSDGGERAA